VHHVREDFSIAVLLLTICAPATLIAQQPASSVARSVPSLEQQGRRDSGPQLPPIKRKVTLHLNGVPLRQALDEISRQSGVNLLYSESFVPLNQLVTLNVENVAAFDALNAVLRGTGVALSISRTGTARLVREKDDSRQAAESGAIVGRVSDAKTGDAIAGAFVRVVGTRLGTLTGDSGTYRLVAVPVGDHEVIVNRIGYSQRSQTITVSADEAITLNVALSPVPTHLDQVVVTALGTQRRLEVGNSIAHIDADSIVPTAPVTSVTDLLSARAPGVQIVEAGGLTGGGEAIRIRGQGSMVLPGDPIVIVDGVREDNSAGGRHSVAFSSIVPGPSRINDIDFSQIATIDVLKGPAASTEYGTDAANGVIVITTKRGAVGSPRWHASAEQALSNVPVEFPDYYYSWGHDTDGAQVQCPLTSIYGGPASTAGSCTVDSVTHFNPYNHAATSIYGTGSHQRYDLSVGGGSDALRYYVAGGLSNESGMVRLPDVFRSQAVSLGMPAAILRPNDQEQRSLRANTELRLGTGATIAINAAYMQSQTNNPSTVELTAGPLSGPSLPDSANNFGYGNYPPNFPLSQFGQLQSDQTTRATFGLSADWQPEEWLKAHVTAGIDHGSTEAHSLLLPQAQAVAGWGDDQGALEVDQISRDIYTIDARASGAAPLGRSTRATTSVGLQLADTKTQGVDANAIGLSPTNLTLNGVAGTSVVQVRDEQATLGGYVEEQIAFADRLFLTGALRLDAGSGFGSAINSALYPKASISWLALQHSGSSVRLRSAFGESGVQPFNGAALQLYTPGVAWQDGGPVSVFRAKTPGNPALKPERSRELEVGADMGFWSNRVSLEFTQFWKTTEDALINENVGWDLGNLGYEANLGEVQNRGLEATLNATLMQSRSFAWDVTLNASTVHNKLVRLAPGVSGTNVGYYQRDAAGFPLYGYWGTRVTYNDANRDHIIEPDEVTVADSATFIGSSSPTREASLATRLSLPRHALSLRALFDYRGGYRVLNGDAWAAAFSGTLKEQNDPRANLAFQARALVDASGAAAYPAGFFEDGTFLRFRELSLTYSLPSRIARAVRVNDLSLTGAVRNLALWTHYSGPDPEVSAPGGQGAGSQFGTGTLFSNYDIRVNGFGAIPLARYWVLRLSAGF